MFKIKKQFYRWIFSYLIVVIIPICFIFLTQNKGKALIKEEIEKAQHLSLKQINNIIKGEIQDLATASYTLYNKDEILTIANLKGELTNVHRFMLYKITDEILELVNYNIMIEDIYIYFNNLDIIVTKTGVVTTKEFYDRYQEHFSEFYEFKQDLSKVYTNDFISMGDDKKEPSLFVLNTMSRGKQATPLVNVMIKVNQNRIKETLDETLWHEGGQTQIIFHQPDKDYIIRSSGGENIQNENDFYSDKYFIQTTSFEKENIDYVSFVPRKSFYKSINSINVIGFGALILSSMIAFIISYVFTRKNNRPLVNLLSQLNIEDARSENEFSIIVKEVANLVKERNMLEGTRKNKVLNIRNSVFMTLLNGVKCEVREIEKVLDVCDVSFLSSFFVVCFLEIEQYVSETSQLEKNVNYDIHKTNQFIVRNIVSEMLVECGKVNFVTYPNKQVIILNIEDNKDRSYKYLIDRLNTAKNYIEYNFKLQLSITLSAVIEGLENIGEGYSQAEGVMNYKVILGRGLLLSYSEIMKGNEANSHEYDNVSLKNQNLYLNLIIGKKLEEALTLAEELLSDLHNPNRAKNAIYILKSLTINGLNNLEMYCTKINLNIEQLVKAGTSKEVIVAISQLFDDVKKVKHSGDKEDIIYEVRNYIDTNYKDYSMNVSFLAEEFNIRLSKLSKQFKEEFGKGVLDYINSKRLTYAKNQLINSSKPILLLAKESGFIDSSSFIRVFKKQNGMTPGAFRQLYAE